MNQREVFLKHVAQTSPSPVALEIVKAEGIYLFDREGRQYLDMIGGISVANTGHRHPKVLQAIQDQLDAYLHVMVYGEFVQTPQVQYAQLLASHLPASLNSVYFTNSGAEAVEGAMKLSKRVTGRTEVLAFDYSYHGSTQGALSIIGSEYWRNAFRPLLPGISHAGYGEWQSLELITDATACVFAETVQGEAGIIAATREWMQALREKCTQTGTLLVLDEIQAGFGRTGKLWGFEHFEIVPDIVLLGKALGGGMPLGAFVADRAMMLALTEDPALGHITTFGGHPVCCAAGMASMEILLEENILSAVAAKEKILHELLVHPSIKAKRSFGLWMAIQFLPGETAKKVSDHCLEGGLLTDWFLFAPDCLRISPPLTITDDQLRTACKIFLGACNKAG